MRATAGAGAGRAIGPPQVRAARDRARAARGPWAPVSGRPCPLAPAPTGVGRRPGKRGAGPAPPPGGPDPRPQPPREWSFARRPRPSRAASAPALGPRRREPPRMDARPGSPPARSTAAPTADVCLAHPLTLAPGLGRGSFTRARAGRAWGGGRGVGRRPRSGAGVEGKPAVSRAGGGGRAGLDREGWKFAGPGAGTGEGRRRQEEGRVGGRGRRSPSDDIR